MLTTGHLGNSLSISASTLSLLDTAKPVEAFTKRKQSIDAAEKSKTPSAPARHQITSGEKLRSTVTAIVESRERHELLIHLRAFKEAQSDRKRDEIARIAAMAVNMEVNGGSGSLMDETELHADGPHISLQPSIRIHNKPHTFIPHLSTRNRMLSTAHEVSESNASSLNGSIDASLSSLGHGPRIRNREERSSSFSVSRPTPQTLIHGTLNNSLSVVQQQQQQQAHPRFRRGSTTPLDLSRRSSTTTIPGPPGFTTAPTSNNPSRRTSLKRVAANTQPSSTASGSLNPSRRGSLSGTGAVGMSVRPADSIMKRKASLRGVAIAVKMTISVGGQHRRPFDETFLTSVDLKEPTVYGVSYAFHRFRRICRLVTIVINFFKFLSRILKNPIQWGWEHDPDANLFARDHANMKRKGNDDSSRGIISTDFSVGKLFNTQKVFKGWLPEQMRALFRKPPRMRSENDITEMQVWASGMKAFREFQPVVQKMLLKVGRYERWHANRTIVKEGHIAMNYYILLDGEIEVSRINRELVDGHMAKIIEQEEKAEKERAEDEEGNDDNDEDDEDDDKDDGGSSYRERESERVRKRIQRKRIERKRTREELERIYTDLLGTQSSGESFGELAFINGNIRLASITTRRTTEFLIIERHHFERVMSISQDTDIREKMMAMKEVSIFKTLSVNLNNLARYVDIPISRDKFIFRPVHHTMKDHHTSGGAFYNPQAANPASSTVTTSLNSSTTLVTKFVVVQHLHPGDHFYDGDSSKTPRELYLASGLGTSASRTSVVANLKTEILKISKLDFNKFATKATWREFVEIAENAMPPIERLSESYMGKRDWEVYKRKIVEDIVRRFRRERRVLGEIGGF
ncbi:hypothetical protein HDU67_007781 [Dinochytrium kinnereticum]|nr:hypothetical protein HDU67_007781 [Dinochytrium kinnereticum]